MSRHASQRFGLLMIDFQRDFCAPGGYADRCGGLEWVTPILPAAQRLLAAARAAGVFVAHTREGYAPDLSDLDPVRRARSRAAGGEYGSPGAMGRLLIRGEYGHEIIDELAPAPGEPVIDKNTYGAFVRSDLESILRHAGVGPLAIAGVTADVCVHTTLREATDRGFACHYVRDAISTFDPDIRRACERMVVQEGGIWGNLTTVKKLKKIWGVSPQTMYYG
ncbi:MAG: cysteine hydrolase [Terrimicrobiaceae bacterium]|nr:cysteine hydrolase [Terrimicrobiaceae bacterium]